jgi:hypothetical protein
MNSLSKLLPVLAMVVVVVGCNDRTRPAMGDEHSVIVVAADSLWAQVEDTVLSSLQTRVFGARDEATFRVTHISPTDPYWGELRRFRQILTMGRPDDSWVQDPLSRASVDPAVNGAQVAEAENVWARGQRVIILVVPEREPAEAVEAQVDAVAAVLDSRYRDWVLNRMYTSGVDAELGDQLARDAGFSLRLPNVYRWRQVADSAYLFINDQPDASQLVRSLLVTWRPADEGDHAVDGILDWREEAAAQYYDWGQDTRRERLQTMAVAGEGYQGLEVRGVWHGTIEGFPQAGSFITRSVDCPDQGRRYLLDAWLYAPARAKYQYMIQLETLLGSFRCQVAS